MYFSVQVFPTNDSNMSQIHSKIQCSSCNMQIIHFDHISILFISFKDFMQLIMCHYFTYHKITT